MPKLSVIIPIYGVEKYIERCAISLFNQTLNDIEFIFIDDCTQDSSMDILNQIIKKNRHRFAEKKYVVRTLRMPSNSGLPAVRRHGMLLATGDYIIHCDSDDWTNIDMYREMYEAAIECDADVVSCDYLYHDGNKILRTMAEHISSDRNTAIIDLMLHKTHWVLWNRMYKRSLLSNTIIYPSNNMGEDMALVLQLMYYSKKIIHVPKPLYCYYLNPSSITNKASEDASINRFKQVYANLTIVLDFYRSKPDYHQFEEPLQYLMLFVKNHIPISCKEGKKMWRQIFRGLEWKMIINSTMTFKERCNLMKTIIKVTI